MEEKKNILKQIPEKFKSLESNKKKFISIICCALILIIVITIITSIIFSSTNGSAGKVVGNLNNKGMAVIKGDDVYLTNMGITDEKDSKTGIYKVTKNNKTTLIEEGEYIKSINYYKGYLYFLSMNVKDDQSGQYVRQIIKMKPDGSKREVLVDDIETDSIANSSLNVSDGWVYYLNADKQLEKIKTNGNKRLAISDEEIEQFQISEKYIYYTTVDNEFGRMKKDGSDKEKLENGIEKFQVVGKDVYYISPSNKHLVKRSVKTSGDEKDEEVVDKQVTTFNIYKKTIYYAVHDTDTNGESQNAIYSINLNGKNRKKIVELSSSDNTTINIVGKWMYYTDKVENSPYYYAIYRVKTNGKDQERVNI